MVDGVNIVGLILFFGGCLALIFILRLNRERKAKKMLNPSENAKLYLAGSQKTISDGIQVYSVNGKKPILGKDSGGNYVVLAQGNNIISAGFISLKDFAPAAAMPGLAPAIINSKKKKDVVECTVKAGQDYMLDFDRNAQVFIINEV